MQSVKRIVLAGIIFVGAMGGFGVGGTPVPAPFDEGKSEPDRAGWKYLSYRGSHFWGDVKTEVSLADLPAGEAQKKLITIPDGKPLETSTSRVMVIDVQSKVDPLFGATDLSGSRAWFAPNDAAAYQRIRTRHGGDIWQNTYRFAERGVYRIRKKPGHADEKQVAPEHWTRIKESFFQYPPTGLESQTVTEPTGLLYLVSVLDLMPQTAPLSVFVFDRKQLHEVKIQVNGRQSLKVSYMEKSHNKEIQRVETIDAVKIYFSPRALVQPGEKPEQFSFFGLRSNFIIFIDPASGLPVQVSGKVPKLGTLHLKLNEVRRPGGAN